jgi:serine/threonine protein kinase/mannose/fructose/N-acetylgalactosamine-specific phosphotransferase system component IIB
MSNSQTRIETYKSKLLKGFSLRGRDEFGILNEIANDGDIGGICNEQGSDVMLYFLQNVNAGALKYNLGILETYIDLVNNNCFNITNKIKTVLTDPNWYYDDGFSSILTNLLFKYAFRTSQNEYDLPPRIHDTFVTIMNTGRCSSALRIFYNNPKYVSIYFNYFRTLVNTYPNVTDKNGDSALMILLTNPNMTVDMLDAIINIKGIDIGQVNINLGWNALCYLCNRRDITPQMLNLLLKTGQSHPEIIDYIGSTPLIILIENPSLTSELMEMLLATNEINVGHAKYDGHALNYLCHSDKITPKMLKLLLQTGKSRPDYIDHEGETPLMILVSNPVVTVRLIEMLLATNQIDIGLVSTKKGWTALFYLCNNRYATPQMLSLLLETGKSRPDYITLEGETALTILQKNPNATDEMKTLLLKAMNEPSFGVAPTINQPKLTLIDIANQLPNPKIEYVTSGKFKTSSANIGSGGYGSVFVPDAYRNVVVKSLKYLDDEYVSDYSEDVGKKRSTTRNYVNIKTISDNTISDYVHQITLTIKECIFIANLRHPNIIPLIGVLNGALYDVRKEKFATVHMILPKLRGDLYDYIQKNGYFNKSVSQNFLFQMCKAFQYLHTQGIFHSDLKPNNILYQYTGSGSNNLQFYLIDFGLAEFYSIPAPKIDVVGTTIYVPCSRYNHNTRFDDKNMMNLDIFSLGLTWYELLTGKRGNIDPSDSYGEVFKPNKFFNPNMSNRDVYEKRVKQVTDIVGFSGWALLKQMLGVGESSISTLISAEQILKSPFLNDKTFNAEYLKTNLPQEWEINASSGNMKWMWGGGGSSSDSNLSLSGGIVTGGDKVFHVYSQTDYKNKNRELAYMDLISKNYENVIPFNQSRLLDLSFIKNFLFLKSNTILFAIQILNTLSSMIPTITNNTIVCAIYVAACCSEYTFNYCSSSINEIKRIFDVAIEIAMNNGDSTVTERFIVNETINYLNMLKWKPILIPYLFFIEKYMLDAFYNDWEEGVYKLDRFLMHTNSASPKFNDSIYNYTQEIQKVRNMAYTILIWTFLNKNMDLQTITLDEISLVAVVIAFTSAYTTLKSNLPSKFLTLYNIIQGENWIDYFRSDKGIEKIENEPLYIIPSFEEFIAPDFTFLNLPDLEDVGEFPSLLMPSQFNLKPQSQSQSPNKKRNYSNGNSKGGPKRFKKNSN